jgi:hypothetical protein
MCLVCPAEPNLNGIRDPVLNSAPYLSLTRGHWDIRVGSSCLNKSTGDGNYPSPVSFWPFLWRGSGQPLA